MKEKSQYKDLYDWKGHNPKHYASAYVQGFLEIVCDRFGWEMPKIKVYLSPEETFKTCVDNELTSGGKYSTYRIDNKYLNLHSLPWKVTKETVAEYFKRVKTELGLTKPSTEETFQTCVDNRLIFITKYKTYRSENKHLNLHSAPWYVTKETVAEYFKRVKVLLGLDFVFLFPEETFQICVDNELISANRYSTYRIENKHLNLHSAPWTTTKETITDYFKRVKVELGINDEILSSEDTFQICVDNKLTSSLKYKTYRNENKHLNLHSAPCMTTKETQAEYFKRVKAELGV